MRPTRNTTSRSRQHDLDLAVAEQPLHLGEALAPRPAPAGPPASMLTPLRSRTASRYESVATSRSRRRRGEQHAGEDRAGVVAATPPARPGAAPPRTRPRRPSRPSPLDLGQAAGSRPPAACAATFANRPASITRLVAGDLDRHRAGLELAHDLGEQPAGTTALPSLLDLGRHLHPDGELEVGADQLDARRSVAGPAGPDSTGSAPVRLATARCAVATASARVSRSQRNFTGVLLHGHCTK